MKSVEIPGGGAYAVNDKTGEKTHQQGNKTMHKISVPHEYPYAGTDDQSGRGHESDGVGGANFII